MHLGTHQQLKNAVSEVFVLAQLPGHRSEEKSNIIKEKGPTTVLTE